MTALLEFAVITIFARETLEGGIIIGEYRTVIMRSNWENASITKKMALRAVTVSALLAALVAVVVCAAVAIPLAILSLDFEPGTAKIIEGVSKIVAAICLLQLSLKMPKFFGLYYSKAQLKKIKNNEPLDETMDSQGMSLRSIRFNVAWNIWREVAECGVFLIPSFLTGEGILAIPLSAVVGVLGDFWSIDRLPMTVFKPFGYNDTRTVLQMCCFWIWMAFSLFIHYLKYRTCMKPPRAFSNESAIARAAGVENSMEEIKEDNADSWFEETREPSDSDLSGGSPRDIEGGSNEEKSKTQGRTIEEIEA
eukprot:jgi/Psemu1/289433/fgenesh1_pg.355_\